MGRTKVAAAVVCVAAAAGMGLVSAQSCCSSDSDCTDMMSAADIVSSNDYTKGVYRGEGSNSTTAVVWACSDSPGVCTSDSAFFVGHTTTTSQTVRFSGYDKLYHTTPDQHNGSRHPMLPGHRGPEKGVSH